MTNRVTKFGTEILGYPYPTVIADPFANTVHPLISESNWRGTFTDETIWQTAISKSQTTGSEEREGRVSRPTRILSTLISGLNREEVARLLANAYSMAGSRYPAAIYSDFTFATNSSTTTISCDTRWRRFFIGQRVAVLPANYSLSATFLQAQIGTIASVTSGTITFEFALDTACAIGDLILPLMDSEISLSQEMDGVTDWVAEWQQECVELSGNSTLPGLSEEDVHHLGMEYFQGLPIFDIAPNWRDRIKVGIARDGSAVQSGNTSIVSPDGGAYLTFAGSFEEYDRKSIWRSARFFDSRKGRLRPFWTPNPLTLFQVTAIDDSVGFFIKYPTTRTHLQPFLRKVWIEFADGRTKLYSVTGTSDSVDGILVNVNDDLLAYASPADLVRVTSAHLCRFDQDSLKRTWFSDGICKFDLTYRSLLDEAVYALE